jgi:replicative DNA helicase
MDAGIENVILNRLVHDDDYMRRVLPYLDDSLFSSPSNKTAYTLIKEFIDKYNKCPSVAALSIEMEERTNLDATTAQQTYDLIQGFKTPELVDPKWLIDTTEKFVQSRSLMNAIMRSISIYKGSDKKLTTAAIPELLTSALAISFNPHIGHDFIEDAKSRYEYYHTEQSRIPFDIDLLNKITKGGVIRKTLNVLMAGTGGGKSLTMCHFAAANLMAGLNVLYITLEMSEEEITKRIDANLLNVTMDDLMAMPEGEYLTRINRIQSRTTGKLIVKEYPTSSANVNHFRALLNDLRLKKNFVPDVIYVDYINICTSSRVRMGDANSYGYIKAIAEELRGLAVENNVPLWTATQVNRNGMESSDVSMTDVSESVGLPFTTDLMLALVSTEEIIALGQMLVIQLKNRYNDLNYFKRFVVGCDRGKMQLFDCEQNAQDDIMDDSPVMDNGEFGERLDEEEVRKMPRSRKKKPSMKGFG